MSDSTPDASPASPPKGIGERIGRCADYLLRHEWVLVLAVGFIVAALWGFLELADEVMEGDTRAADVWVLEQLRTGDDLADVAGPHWVEKAVIELTSLGGISFAVVLTTLVVITLVLAGRIPRAIAVALAMAGGAVWITLLKNFYDRARPTEVAHLMEESTKSFPSGHASIASTLYLTLGLLLAQLSHTRRFKVFFLSAAIMLTLLVGITRLALGVHYPTDVLGGWLLGGAWALGVWTLTHLIERRLDRADAASQRAVEAASRKHGGGGHEDLGAVEMHRT